jgi:hypothetical protein
MVHAERDGELPSSPWTSSELTAHVQGGGDVKELRGDEAVDQPQYREAISGWSTMTFILHNAPAGRYEL